MRVIGIDEKGIRIPPEKRGQPAYCQVCKNPVMCVCPTCDISKYWRHTGEKGASNHYCPQMASYDYQDKSSKWHKRWQELIDYYHIEYDYNKNGTHYGDILDNNDNIIELQHSTTIPPEVISEREDCYGDMTWVLDTSQFLEKQEYECKVCQGIPQIVYKTNKRAKKIKWFKKQVYLHMPCGALVFTKMPFENDAISGEIAYWKDFVDKHISEVLDVEYPGLCPPNMESNHDCKYGLSYPHCLFSVYFKKILSIEDNKQIRLSNRIQKRLSEYESYIKNEINWKAELNADKIEFDKKLNDLQTLLDSTQQLLSSLDHSLSADLLTLTMLCDLGQNIVDNNHIFIELYAPAIWDYEYSQKPITLHVQKIFYNYPYSFIYFKDGVYIQDLYEENAELNGRTIWSYSDTIVQANDINEVQINTGYYELFFTNNLVKDVDLKDINFELVNRIIDYLKVTPNAWISPQMVAFGYSISEHNAQNLIDYLFNEGKLSIKDGKYYPIHID